MIADRYRLEREIGRGGMGAVWLARDEVLGRQVAIKRIGTAPGGATPDLQRAEREARLAARLNHPHVVAVFDLVTDAEGQWLVMEYVEGITLSGLIARDGPMSAELVTPVLAQAADALAAAHESAIVHRDVKPSNILVGADGHVKLSDFGIARAEADATLTQTGLVTGSPAYLAPEVASGQAATDASDVWSLGATAYHALAGRPPYEVGDNLMGALYRIVNEDPPRLTNAGWLTPFLEASMTREPAHRWSMAQVRDFLRAGPSDVAVHPTPATRAETASPTRVFQPPPTSAPPAAAEAAPAPPARSRSRSWLPLVLAAAVLVALGIAAATLLANGDGSPGASPDDPPDTSRTDTTDPAEPTVEGMESFISDYLRTAPTSPETTFEMLTPEFQEASGGYGGYSGYWNTVESAELVDVTADPEALTVAYTVDYVMRNGEEPSDEVLLRLVFRDGKYLIAEET